MSEYVISKYSSECSNDWDRFVLSAKNSHFMFIRAYMDYHADRFDDFSLVIRNQKGTICALLPANSKNGVIYSHQGLTFGGLITPLNISLQDVVFIFEAVKFFLQGQGIVKLIYKAIPYIYCKLPSQDDLYALHLLGAQVYRRDVSSTIDLSMPVRYSKGRKWSVKKANKEAIDVAQSDDFEGFWILLNDVLKAQHGTSPVHSYEEIKSLSEQFENNIKLFTAKYKGQLVAGAVVYETETVAHTQYLANSLIGREIGALDLLLNQLIKEEFKNKKFFDFGISTEEEGKRLNSGLISQKEGFGARSIVHDFYELEIL